MPPGPHSHAASAPGSPDNDSVPADPALAACSVPHEDEHVSFPSRLPQRGPGTPEWDSGMGGMRRAMIKTMSHRLAGLDASSAHCGDEMGAGLDDSSSTRSEDGSVQDSGSEGSADDVDGDADVLEGGPQLTDDDGDGGGEDDGDAAVPLQLQLGAVASSQWDSHVHGAQDDTDAEEEEFEEEEEEPERESGGIGLDPSAVALVQELVEHGMPVGVAQPLLRALRGLQWEPGRGWLAVLQVEGGGEEEEESEGVDDADDEASYGACTAFTNGGLVFNYWSKAPLG